MKKLLPSALLLSVFSSGLTIAGDDFDSLKHQTEESICNWEKELLGRIAYCLNVCKWGYANNRIPYYNTIRMMLDSCIAAVNRDDLPKVVEKLKTKEVQKMLLLVGLYFLD